MADEVTITNQALSYLGVDPISSLNDNIKSAKLAKAIYEDLRDACLEEGDWSFALGFYTLTPDATLPEFGEGQYFTVPNDVIRVIEVNENNYAWSLEGNKVRTTEGTARMKTVDKVLDANLMSPMFRQAISARMAMELALPLTQSKTMSDRMIQLFDVKIDAAKANDGMQGTSKKFNKGRLIGARQNGADLGGRNNVFGPYV